MDASNGLDRQFGVIFTPKKIFSYINIYFLILYINCKKYMGKWEKAIFIQKKGESMDNA